MKAQIQRYEQELAGTGFTTLAPDGWDFESYYGDTEVKDGHEYHLCLSRRAAQYTFALDQDLSVFVWDDSWIKLYNSVFDLVQLETAFYRHLPSHPDPIRIEPLGHFGSIAEFESTNAELLRTFRGSKCDKDDLNAIYYGQGEVITVGRFYDHRDFSLYAIRYS